MVERFINTWSLIIASGLAVLLITLISLFKCAKNDKGAEGGSYSEDDKQNSKQSRRRRKEPASLIDQCANTDDNTKSKSKPNSKRHKKSTNKVKYSSGSLSYKFVTRGDPALTSMYDFAVKFYNTACKPHHERKPGSSGDTLYSSKVVSPLVLQCALYPCYLGAGGKCKDEIRQTIYPSLPNSNNSLDDPARDVATDLDALMNDVGITSGFAVALRVYAPANSVKYSTEFHNVINTCTGRLCEFVEFRFDNSGSRPPLPLATVVRSMNRFVTGASGSEIKSPLTEEMIDTVLNADRSSRGDRSQSPGFIILAYVRIKCRWTVAFLQKETWPVDFHIPGGYKTPVDMMCTRSSQFGYHQDVDLQIVRLPLLDKDSKTDIYILLPMSRGNLEMLEKHLSGERIRYLMNMCQRNVDVKIFLPKMFVDSKLNPSRTRESLESMGMKLAFSSETADFGPMLENSKSNQKLHIAAIFHDAILEAYEEAGCQVVEEKFTNEASRVVKADQPFVFVVAGGNQRQLPLMIGRFAGRPFYKATASEGASENRL